MIKQMQIAYEKKMKTTNAQYFFHVCTV